MIASKEIDHREFFLKHGHAPLAHRVVCVDFDGTIFPKDELFNFDLKPEAGAVAALQALNDADWHIVIWTSRMSRQWLKDSDNNYGEQYAYVAAMCNKWGIPFNRIIGEKIPAQVYIDDKAIEYTGKNWKQIQRRVLGL